MTDKIIDGKKPATTLVRATIAEVYTDYKKGKTPWRALVHDMMGRQLLVVADHPMEAIAGDDIQIHGYKNAADDIHTPDEFFTAEPVIRNVAHASFGGKTAEERKKDSGKALDIEGLNFRAGEERKTLNGPEGMGITIFKAPTKKSSHPLYSWIQDIFKDIPQRGPVIMANPFNFIPSVGPLDDADLLTRGAMSSDNRGDLEKLRKEYLELMPAIFARILTNHTVHNFRMPDGHIIEPPMGGGNLDRGGSPKIVVPPSPYEGTNVWFANISGLKASEFVTTVNVMPRTRQMFDLLSLMAKASCPVEGYGAGATHFENSFGDAFAIMATLKKTGDIDSVRKIIEMRKAASVTGSLLQATGPALEAALEHYEKHAKDEWDMLDLLHIAHDIAGKTYMEDKEIKDLQAARLEALKPISVRKTRDYGISSGDMEAVIEHLQAMSDKKDGFVKKSKLFAAALEALDNNIISAKKLDDDGAASEKYGKLYVEDLANMQASLNGRASAVLVLLAKERSAFGLTARNQDLRDYAEHEAKLEAKRAGKVFEGLPAEDGSSIKEWRKQAISKTAMPNYLRSFIPNFSHNNGAAVTIIRNSNANKALQQAFSLSPAERLAAYEKALQKEAEALKAGKRGAKPSIDNLAVASKASRLRHELAFALRADKDGRALIESRKDEVLSEHLKVAARYQGKNFATEDARAGRREALLVLKSLKDSKKAIILAAKKAKAEERAAAAARIREKAKLEKKAKADAKKVKANNKTKKTKAKNKPKPPTPK